MGLNFAFLQNIDLFFTLIGQHYTNSRGLCTQQALAFTDSCVQQNSDLGTLTHPSSAAVACMCPYKVVFIYINLKKPGANVIITNNREAIERGRENETQEVEKWANWEMTRARRNFRVRWSVAVEAQAGRQAEVVDLASPARLHPPGRPDKSKFECSSRVQQRAAPHLPLSSPDWQEGGRPTTTPRAP
jgi:hypothetical protein